MKIFRYSLVAAVLAFAACSSDTEEQLPADYSGVKVNPDITVTDSLQGKFTKAGTGQSNTGPESSTYFKVGEHVGILLLDDKTNQLYSDTKEVGVLRYTYDGVYWGTYDAYGMTEDYCRVYCFYPYPDSEDHSYDGLWPNSYRKIETASNTDYLWGESVIPSSSPGVNGMTPQVHIRMNHALCRVSFQLKRKLAYDPNSTIGKGAVTSFNAQGFDASNRSMHGTSKYCFITGNVVTPVTADKNPVSFSTLAGNSIPQPVNSTLGDTNEFMSMVPGTGTIKINLTIDGQSYLVTIPAYTYRAGYHYLITLEYTGSQIIFPDGSGATDGKMKIIPWTSGGSIGVKGLIER